MAARVLIPVDNQECTVSALKSISLRSWEKDTKFLLLKVVEDFSGLLYANELQHSEALSTEQEEYTYEMRMWLNELTDSFSSTFPDTQSRLERGNVAQRICEVACEWYADYIVIGSHDRQLSSRCALGSVASEVIRLAPCSAEAVRYKELHRLLMQEGKISGEDIDTIVCPPSKVIVAVDLKPTSDDVINWVGSIGWPENAQIRLLTIVQSQHREEISHWHRGVGTLFTKEGQHHKIVETNLHSLQEKLSKVCSNKVDSVVIKHDTTATAIIDAANEWGADFVVIGASGKRLDSTATISTPLDVIAGLHCTMVVIDRNTEKYPTFSWRKDSPS